MRLFWHRRDPRTRDMAGLSAAASAARGTVVPVFVSDADLFETTGARGAGARLPGSDRRPGEGYERAKRVFEEALGKR